MATSKRELSKKVNSAGESEIILRISAGRGVQPRIKTGIFIKPSRFKNGAIVKPRSNQKEAAELRKAETDLIKLELFLVNICSTSPKEIITKDYLSEQTDRYRFPEKYKQQNLTHKSHEFFEVLNEFLTVRDFSERRIKHYEVLMRALRRFEVYKRITGAKDYKITLDGFNVDEVNDFEIFLRSEHTLCEKYPDIYKTYPDEACIVRRSPKPQQRGNNTIISIFKPLRAFFNWCNKQDITHNRPFDKYEGGTAEKYGTPYYITIEERNHIAAFDLSATPDLAVQRDIFIFQCLVGCRVSDLLRLTSANIIGGGLEYIPNKTKQERPEVIRVPLHNIAAELVKKYSGAIDGRLFPFISAQKYNEAIKQIFTACGITRSVTVLNTTTGKEEQRPINEVVSSHIARRTFAGNLYRKVKDPNLVGKLTGHKEGSKAFARYRDIDEEMKKEVINLLGE